MSLFKKLFKEAGVKDVITLFHAPNSPNSIRVHTLLKQTAASLQTTATLDQAGSHDQAPKTDRTKFDLRLSNPMGRPVTSTANAHPEIEAESPTEDQLQSILDYAGEENAGTIVEGATSKKDALYKFKTQHGANLIKPLVVDWNKGRVVSGDNQSEILKLLKASPSSST